MSDRTSVICDEKAQLLAQETIRVVIGDSREAMREGLRQMLGNDDSIKVVGEAGTNSDVSRLIKELEPDILILDGKMRGADEKKIINKLKSISPSLNIIIINDDKDLLVPSVENGVSGFVTRDIKRNELVTLIRIIYLWRLVLFNNGTHYALVRL